MTQETILFSLAEITLTMSALILLLFGFTRLFGKRYTAGCRYVLWILVILRLCVPLGNPFLPALIELPMPVPEESAAEETVPYPSADTDIPETLLPSADTVIPEQSETTAVQTAPVPAETVSGSPAPVIPEASAESMEEEGNISENIPEKFSFRWDYDTVITALFRLWLAGVILAFGVRLAGYMLVSRQVRRSLTEPTPEQADLCRRLGETLGIRSRHVPKLMISPTVRSPMLCGYFRPVVVLPDITLTQNQLTGVLAHELTHYRRNDLWVKLACMTATSLHWFNPLVHLAAARCNRDMELSCDELVLSGMDEAVRLTYGKVMLDIIKRCRSSPSSLTTHFNPRKSAVSERFDCILDGTKKYRGLWITVLMLALCVMAGMLIAWRQAEPETQSRPEENPAETAEDQKEDSSAEEERAYYELTMTAGETYRPFDGVLTAYSPVPYGSLDLTGLADGTLPLPVNSAETYENLRYYNQITDLTENTAVFAVTGSLFTGRDPNFAYVLCKDGDTWNITALPAHEDGVCKGVSLRAYPMENTIGYLLALYRDDGGVQFFRSEDGALWEGTNHTFQPGTAGMENAWLVQFSDHTGIGGETLCLVMDAPDWEREQIWLSYDWGETFTQYEIPVTDVLPGDYTDSFYIEKFGGAGSGEYTVLFQVNSARNSRYVRFQSVHGSTAGAVSFVTYEDNLISSAVRSQYRYTGAADRGAISFREYTPPAPDVPVLTESETAAWVWQVYSRPDDPRAAGYSTGENPVIPYGQIGVTFTIPPEISADDMYVSLEYLYSDEADAYDGVTEDGYYPTEETAEDPWTGPRTREAMEFFSTSAGDAVYERTAHYKLGYSSQHYTVRVSRRYLVHVTFALEADVDETAARKMIQTLRYTDNTGLMMDVSWEILQVMLEEYLTRAREAEKLNLWEDLPVDTSAEPIALDGGRYVPAGENEYGITTIEELAAITASLIHTSSEGWGIYEGPVYGEDGKQTGASMFRSIDGKLYVNLDGVRTHNETLDMDLSSITDIALNGAQLTFRCRYGAEGKSREYSMILQEGKLYT